MFTSIVADYLPLILCLSGMILWGIKTDKTTPQTGRASASYDTNPKYLPWSLFATNLSITGGVMAFMQVVQTRGFPSLILPFTTLCGWALFLRLRRSLQFEKGGNTVTDISTEINSNGFRAAYNAVWAILLTLTAGWEMYAGSSLIAQMMGRPTDSLIIGFLIATSIFAYLRKSAFSAVTRTDLLQSILAFFLIVVIVINVFRGGVHQDSPILVAQTSKSSNDDIFWFFIPVAVMNLGYQIMNPVNWHFAAAASKANTSITSVFRRAGIGVAAVWLILYFCVINTRLASPYPDLVLYEKNIYIKWLVQIGICGFLLSTVDTLVFTASTRIRTSRDAIIGKTGSEPTRQELGSISGCILVCALVMSWGLIRYQPSLFFSLLGIFSSFFVFLPLLLTVRIWKRTDVQIPTLFTVQLLFLFVASTAISIIYSLLGAEKIILAIPAASSLISCLLTVFWIRKTRRFTKNGNQ